MTVVQVYALTTDCEEGVIEEFYKDLEKLLKDVPRKDILIVQGDWNAKIGPYAYEQWKGTVGRFGLKTTNER